MLSTLLSILLTDVVVKDQASQAPEVLFVSDRIFTVLTVVLIVFVGVLVMLLRQERRLSKLEKQVDKKP